MEKKAGGSILNHGQYDFIVSHLADPLGRRLHHVTFYLLGLSKYAVCTSIYLYVPIFMYIPGHPVGLGIGVLPWPG